MHTFNNSKEKMLMVAIVLVSFAIVVSLALGYSIIKTGFNTEIISEEVVETQTHSENEENQGRVLTAEERMQVLKELEESEITISSVERKATLESIESNEPPQISAEDRMKILDELNNN